MLSSAQRNKVSATLRALKTKEWCESPDIDLDRKRNGMIFISNGQRFFMHKGHFDNLGVAMLIAKLEELVTDEDAPNSELKRMEGDEIVPDAEEKPAPAPAVVEETSEPPEEDDSEEHNDEDLDDLLGDLD